MNLGISESFGAVEYDLLTFPSTMRIDYVRVYQDPNAINIGCDPPGFPTAAYIEQYVPSRLPLARFRALYADTNMYLRCRYSEAYHNPNLTTWVGDYGQTMPKNKYLGQC